MLSRFNEELNTNNIGGRLTTPQVKPIVGKKIWFPNCGDFIINSIDFSLKSIFFGGDNEKHQVNFTNPEKIKWVCLYISKVNFTVQTTKSNKAKFTLDGRSKIANCICRQFILSQTPFPQTMTIDYVRAYKEIK